MSSEKSTPSRGRFFFKPHFVCLRNHRPYDQPRHLRRAQDNRQLPGDLYFSLAGCDYKWIRVEFCHSEEEGGGWVKKRSNGRAFKLIYQTALIMTFFLAYTSRLIFFVGLLQAFRGPLTFNNSYSLSQRIQGKKSINVTEERRRGTGQSLGLVIFHSPTGAARRRFIIKASGGRVSSSPHRFLGIRFGAGGIHSQVTHVWRPNERRSGEN